MFGAGLPVCAVDYPCITELVQPGVTGLLFRDAPQLATQLQQLLSSGGDSKQLATLRAGVAKHQLQWRWQDNWQAVAAPVIAHYSAAAAGGGCASCNWARGLVGLGGSSQSSPPPPSNAKKVA